MNNDLAYIFVAVFLLLLITGFALAFALLFRPWMQVFLSGGRITLPTILAMRLRGLPVKAICDSYIMMLQCGVVVDVEEIQKAHLMLRHYGIVASAAIASKYALAMVTGIANTPRRIPAADLLDFSWIRAKSEKPIPEIARAIPTKKVTAGRTTES